MKSSGHPSFPKVCVLVLMLASYTDTFVVAAPRAPRVVSGSATFQQDGNLTIINAGNRSIINYQGFDIGANETVRFVQPGATSTVLNRVISPNPTNIFGQLQSNGIVYIVNPYGVYFQNGSVLNVGGVVAAAGRISDGDFTAGRIHFTDLAGDVRNDGVLAADNRIALLGANVVNNGTMTVARGVAMMTSGSDVYVGEKGGNIFVQANGAAAVPGAAAGSVTNAGKVAAPRVVLGAGDMYSTAIVNTGLLQGSSVAVNAGRNGTATVGGKLDAAARTAKQNGGKGGTVEVTGGTVALKGATLDASGVNGGGSVRVGGDFHGAGTLAHANTTTVDAATTIKADATGAKGNGGSVVLWSDQTTRFAGNISARGGSTKGNGGQAEVSSENALDYSGLVDLRAAGGIGGSLLLDPLNINIVDSGDALFPLTVPVGQVTFDYTGTAEPYKLSSSALQTQLALTPVTLQARNDITFQSSVSAAAVGTNSLTLDAGHSIIINAGVTLNLNGALVATINHSGNFTDADNTTAATFLVNPTGTISTPGAVTVNVDSRTALTPVINLGGTINAGSLATVNLTGASGSVAFTGGTVTTSGAAGQTYGQPVVLSAAAVAPATTGVTTLTANGGGTITFSSRVSASGDTGVPGQDLSLVTANTGTDPLGAITFNGPVSASGGTAALNSLTTNTGSPVNLNGGEVTTSGAQTYGGTVTLGSGTATTTLSGGTLTAGAFFNGAGTQSLTLNFTNPPSLASGTAADASRITLNNLNNLTVGSNGATLVGDLTTAGFQDYSAGPVTLGADVTLTSNNTTAANAAISFAAVDSDATARLLAVNTVGLTTFGGAVGSTNALRTLQTIGTGAVAINGGSVRTAGGGQSYLGAVTLGAPGGATILTDTNAGAISFQSTLDGAMAGTQALTLSTTGDQTFTGAVGTTTLASLSTGTGRVLLNGGLVATSGAQTYNGPVTLGATGTTPTTTLRGATLTPGAFIQGGGTQSLTLNFTNGVTLAGGTAATAGQLTLSGINNFRVDGSGATLVGDLTTVGSQTYSLGLTLGANVTLTSSGGGAMNFAAIDSDATATPRTLTISTTGTTTLGGAVGTTPLTSLTVGTGPIAINGGSVTTNGFQAYNGNVTLGANTVLTSLNTAGDGGTLTFGQTVDSDATTTPRTLQVNSPGNTTFNGRVGGTAPLLTFASDAAGTVGGATIFNVANASQNTPTLVTIRNATSGSGAQVYNDGVQLQQSAYLVSTFGSGVSAGGPITFNGTITNYPGAASQNLTLAPGTGQLTINAAAAFNVNQVNLYGGQAIFNQPVGTAASPLNLLTVIASGNTSVGTGSIRISNGGFTTSLGQDYHAPVTLGANTILADSANSNIHFFSAVDSDAPATPRSLTINTGGQTSFDGAVGGTAALLSLTTNNAGVNGEATQINGGAVTTTGAQAYNDAVTLGADTLLTSTTAGNIAFALPLNGTRALTINTTGNTTFNGRVGGTAPLLSLTTDSDPANRGGATIFNVAGSTAAAPTLTTVNTGGTGAQVYNDNVQLQQATVLASAVGAGATNGGAITFNGAIINAPLAAGAQNLTLFAGSGQTIVQSGAAFRLNGLSLDGALVTFTQPLGTTASPLNLLTVTANGSGTRSISLGNGGYSTNLGQSYLAPVFLTANTTLADTGGLDIVFQQTVDSDAASTPRSLSITTAAGHEDFVGSVGSIFALSSLTTGGGTARFGSAAVSAPAVSINTTGTQTYNDPVLLRADTTVNAGNAVRFNLTLDSATAAATRNLVINTPADVFFERQVGSVAPLLSLRVNPVGTAGGTTRFDMPIPAPAAGGVSAGVTVGAGGIAINNSTLFNATGSTGPQTPVVLVYGNGTQTYSAGTSTYTNTATTVQQNTFLVGTGSAAAPTAPNYTNGGAVTFGANNGVGPISGTGPQTLTIYTGLGLGANYGTINVGEFDPAPAAVTFYGNVSALSLLRLVANPGAGSGGLIGYDINNNVTTSGAQNYPDLTFLSRDVTLTSTGAGDITFAGRLNSLPATNFALTLNTLGQAVFNGRVGGITPLGSLTTGLNPLYRGGTTLFNVAGNTVAPSVTTTGVQEYYTRVLLNADTTLTSPGGSLIFHNTVDSFAANAPRALELNSSGDELFEGRVGGTNALLRLVTDADPANRGGRTIFNVAGSATATPGVVTLTTQDYNDAVRLRLDTVLAAGGTITFHNTVDSFVDDGGTVFASNLEVNSADDEVFLGNVGVNNALRGLVTDADPANRGGRTVFGAAGGAGTFTVVTANDGVAQGGAQTFNDAVVLNLDTTLTSNATNGQAAGGNVTFNRTVDGPVGLTVNTGALTIFNGLVGSATPLTFLATNTQGLASGQTQFLMTLAPNAAGVRVGGDVTIGNAVLFNAAGTASLATPTVLTFNNGRQSYLGATTVASNTVLVGAGSTTAPAAGVYAGGGAILFARSVVSANASNLTISTGTGTTVFRNTVTVGSLDLQGANVTFADTVNGLGNLVVARNDAVPGLINLSGGTVQTSAGLTTATGDQFYRDAVSLGADARLTDTAGSNIYFNSTVDGAYTLALNTTGDEYFQGLVGSSTPLFALTIDAALDPAGNLGTARFNMTPAGQATGIAGVRVGAGGLLINDTAAFNVAGSTATNPSLLVYGNGTQTYNGAVNLLTDTFLVGTDAATAPTSATYTGGGAILFARAVTGTVPPTPNLTIYTGAGLETYKGTVNVNTFLPGGATVTFLGNVSGINTLQTVANTTSGVSSGSVDINNNVTTATTQTYNVPVVLSTDVLLTAGGNILFARTVDSDGSGTYALTISNPGAVTIFNGAVGGNKPLLSLTTGVAQINGGSVTTAGFQTYGGAVTLGDDVTLSGGSDIRFASTLDGAHNLTVNTPGDEFFEGLVGSTAPLNNLTVDGLLPISGTTHFDMAVGTAAAGVNVTGIVTINDAVTFNVVGASLNQPTVLAGVQQNYGSFSGSNTPISLLQPTFLQIGPGSSGIEGIVFRGTVDGAFDLTLNALGDEVFEGVVGGTTPLASLTVDNLYNPSHTPDGGTTSTRFGTTIFSLDQPTTGAAVNIRGVLTINDQTQFSVRGGSSTDPTRPAVLTGGAQTYYSLVTLTYDTALRSSGGGDLTFSGGVNSAVGTPRALALYTDGQKIFNAGVGGNALLSLTTSAGGATQINGVNVTTTGFQTYNSPVLLGANANLTSGGGDITFNSTLDGAHDLVVNTTGNEIFNGRVGGTAPLLTLRVDTIKPGLGSGQTIFNVAGSSAAAPSVTTVGLQTYNDAVNPAADTFLTSTGGGAISFNTTVDGPAALTLSTAGAMTFSAPVGGTLPLGGLTAGGGGTIFLDGATVATSGSQTYNGPVLFSTDTTLASTGTGEIRFGSTLDGAHTLTINTAGDEFFDGLVGSQAPLTNLFVDDPGNPGGTAHFDMAADGALAGVNVRGNVAIRDNVAFAANLTGSTLVPTVRTGGSQAYQGTVDAGSAGTTLLQAPSGNVVFLGTVNVSSNLLRVEAQRILAHDIRAAAVGTHSLDLEATELLLLAGNTYNLGNGTISLNTDSSDARRLADTSLNDAATIVLKPANNGQVSFAAGNFAMGYLQTMLTFGSVGIRASNEATLSSIEATGRIGVDAPNLTLLTRPATVPLQGRNVGLVFAAPVIDFGGGTIRFQSLGAGDANTAAFISTTGSVVVQRVPGISLFSDAGLSSRFDSLSNGAAQYDTVARETMTDLEGTTIRVSNDLSRLPTLRLDSLQGKQFLDVAAALAGALPLLNHDLDLPSDGLAITAAQLEQLKKLGINPRLAERNERSSIRDKRALFAQLVDKNDTENYGRLQPIKGAVSRLVPSDFVVVVDRMSAVEVQSILQAFEQVYGKDQTKVPTISDKLQAAYVDYVTASPNGGNDGHGFATFVQKNPAKYDLNPTVRDFDNLFGRLEGLGLTEVEVAKSEEHIVHNIQPTGLSDPETRRFINDLRKGLPSDQRAPSNSQPPSPPVGAPASEKKPTPAPHTAKRQKPAEPAARQVRQAPALVVPGRSVAER